MDMRLDFSVQNQSIPNALAALSETSGVNIAFSSQFFDAGKRVSLELRDTAMEEILSQLLSKTGVKAKTSGDRILLYRKKIKPFTFSGFVTDAESGEAMVGASVYAPRLGLGAVTNEYGFFSIDLPPGSWYISVRYVGYQMQTFPIPLDGDLERNVALKADLVLQNVVISPEQTEAALSAIETGRGLRLNPDFFHSTPSLGGVEDPVRASAMLPGVQGAVDGTAGLHVRGGDPGHNLMLLDGAPIFIPFHLLGAYSVYNSHAVKAANLVKGGFSARYGGRLASVFDVRLREGDMHQWHGGAYLNLSQFQGLVEGPIKKGKGAVLASGRFSPQAFLLGPVFDRLYFPDPAGELESTFFDFNFKANYKLGQNDRVYLSLFHGADEFGKEYASVDAVESSESETEVSWGNWASSLRWNHLFSERLFVNTTLTYSIFNFSYSTFDRFVPQDTSALQSLFFINSSAQNSQVGLNADFDYRSARRHALRFGLGASRPIFKPVFSYFDQDTDPDIDLSTVDRATLEELALEDARKIKQGHVYVEDNFTVSPKFKTTLGLRTSLFAEEDDAFILPEPRIGLYFLPRENLTLHAQGNRMLQYLHLIPNTALRFPNDIWITSREDIRPQDSWMGEIGADWQPSSQLQFSADLYYKAMFDLYALPDSLAYLQSADLTTPETYLMKGRGQSYGMELMAVLQSEGRMGMVSYTLSKSTRQYEGINLGLPFPHVFDRRHQLSVFLSQQFGKGFQAGLNWIYMSPNPQLKLATVESGIGFSNADDHAPGEKNQARSIAYHRLDINLSYRFQTGKASHQVKAGLYNMYNRKNVAFYNFQNGASTPQSGIPLRLSLGYDFTF